jgi:putative flippase GtrA
MIRFAVSSLLCTAVDVFWLCFFIEAFERIELGFLRFAAAALCARLISALINYIVNNRAVFKPKSSIKAFGKYLLFAVPRAVAAALLTGLAAGVLSFSVPWVIVVRVLAAFLLFATSFKLQYIKIFK